ncbi:hypothetical protein KC19_VG260200 [Ceratodon purpureus]|uniref:Uncharacterized protein n=1 Tax=Ceratodon purpureus TaxID=3225 RepID=A0A8T0HUJ9_CERPU|nr:hypothetical protein KC19_VG260200 [Ceratodon purpureus]
MARGNLCFLFHFLAMEGFVCWHFMKMDGIRRFTACVNISEEEIWYSSCTSNMLTYLVFFVRL